MATFHGEWYLRKRSDSYRNRRTGAVVDDVKLKKRRGKRNKGVFWTGSKFIGAEPNYAHVYAYDPKKSPSEKKKFETRVRKNKAFAGKPRKAHKRRLR